MARLMSVEDRREYARERQRRYRLRKKIERHGVVGAQQDMRGRHGNHLRGEDCHFWKGGPKAKPRPERLTPSIPKPCACGCGQRVRTKRASFAHAHYNRLTPERVVERFWSKVNRADGCWEWGGARNSRGYGWFRFGATRVPSGTHRVAYELTYGEIPPGLGVLHRCDNPPCVRPDHLFLGSAQDNNADKMAKGRHPNSRRTSCRHGHPFDEANTYITPSGKRACRTCNRTRQRQYADRRKVA